MLSYTLIHSSDFTTGPNWDHLVADVLGQKVHPDRIRGFCLAREALRKQFLAKGTVLEVSDLQLDLFDRLKNDENFTLSLSHTPQWGAAVLADRKTYRAVGIDIESQSRIVKDAIIERISHPNDVKLSALHTWTIKEACFKTLMNTRLFNHPVEFSSLLISNQTWGHHDSGLQGEWSLKTEAELVLALSWIKN